MTDILSPLRAWRLERDRRRTLARFLVATEHLEDAAPDKTSMTAHLLRSTFGTCDGCRKGPLILHRFGIDPHHLALLSCACADAEALTLHGRGICDRHLAGVAPDGGPFNAYGRSVWCHSSPEAVALEFPDACRVAWWLSEGHVPWLCPRCWRALVLEEAEHLATQRE